MKIVDGQHRYKAIYDLLFNCEINEDYEIYANCYVIKHCENKNKHIVYNAILCNEEKTKNYKSRLLEDNEYMKGRQIFMNMSQPAVQKGGFLIILAVMLLKIQNLINNQIKSRKNEDIKIRVYMLEAKSKGNNRKGMIWLIIKIGISSMRQVKI